MYARIFPKPFWLKPRRSIFALFEVDFTARFSFERRAVPFSAESRSDIHFAVTRKAPEEMKGKNTDIAKGKCTEVNRENCKVQGDSSVEKSLLSNVVAAEVNVSNALLVNVSAKKIKGSGGILYNVVDDSEDGITLNDGDVRADIVTASGEKISMKTNLSQDSGKAWKIKLDGNDRSFEDIYKMNLQADLMAAFAKAKEMHAALRGNL